MKIKDIRSMSTDEIENKIIELDDKLFKQKMQKSLGQSENPLAIHGTKKDIAKLKTILTEMRRKNEGTKKEN